MSGLIITTSLGQSLTPSAVEALLSDVKALFVFETPICIEPAAFSTYSASFSSGRRGIRHSFGLAESGICGAGLLLAKELQEKRLPCSATFTHTHFDEEN